MFFPKTKREIPYPKPEPVAFADAEQALAALGQVKKADPAGLSIEGFGWYGMQRIRVRVKVEPNPGGSMVVVTGSGDDFWGYGAKKVVEEFVKFLGQGDGQPAPVAANPLVRRPEPVRPEVIANAVAKLLAVLFFLVGALTVGIQARGGAGEKWYAIGFGVGAAVVGIVSYVLIVRLWPRKKPTDSERQGGQP